MCVYSMIMDHYHDKWRDKFPYFPAPDPAITSEEIRQLRREMYEMKELLKKAQQYDQKNNQPDCEIEEKKRKLKEFSKLLGTEIEFP